MDGHQALNLSTVGLSRPQVFDTHERFFRWCAERAQAVEIFLQSADLETVGASTRSPSFPNTPTRPHPHSVHQHAHGIKMNTLRLLLAATVCALLAIGSVEAEVQRHPKANPVKSVKQVIEEIQQRLSERHEL